MSHNKIMARLQEHKDAVIKLGYTPIYVALQGSQNYNLAYEGSDIDTKAIVLPSLDDIVYDRPRVSLTHVMENNEHCDVKDIRLMFECFKKQNINFLEILFSPYFIMDDDYIEDLSYLRMFREEIARFEMPKAINCIAGMAMEKLKALEHPYPTIKWKIDKWGYDGKQLHHIIRMAVFLDRYICGVSFEECLTDIGPAMKESMMKAKRNEYSLEDARRLAQRYMKWINDMRAEAPTLDTYREEINPEATKVLDDVLMRAIKFNLKKQLLEETKCNII